MTVAVCKCPVWSGCAILLPEFKVLRWIYLTCAEDETSALQNFRICPGISDNQVASLPEIVTPRVTID